MDNQALPDPGAGHSIALGRPFYSEQTLDLQQKKLWFVILLCFYFIVQARVKLICTFGTDTMTKFCVRMLPDIYFNLLPEAVIITNIFAVRADGEQTFQRLNIVKRSLKARCGFLKPGYISDDYPQRYN